LGNLRQVAFVVAIAAVGGACSMPMYEALRDITPGNGVAAATASPTILTCSSAARMLAPKQAFVGANFADNVIKIRPLDLAGVRQNLQVFQAKVLHPELQKERVVQELFRAVGTTIYQAHTRSLQLAYSTALKKGDLVSATSLQQSIAQANAEGANTDVFGQPGDLNDTDFLSFATTLRHVILEASTTNPRNASAASTPGNFDEAFVNYFQAYFQGKYVDRFGDAALPAPSNLQTINDTEIAGTVQVFLELIMDYTLQTPIWYDNNNNYYPGSGSSAKNTPTVVAVNKMANGGGMPLTMIKLLPDGSAACGITKLKAQAIQYIAETAGNRAEALGGEIGGSFGGINLGLGVLGKISIGDNKTIHAIITTALQKTFTRAGEEASYRILEVIPDPGTTLAALIEQYLAAQLAALPNS
jgi:hypothetical protein